MIRTLSRCFSGISVAASIAVASSSGCAVRVGSDDSSGSGGPGGPGGGGNQNSQATSGACTRVGNEVKLAAGQGSDTFAFLWDGDHYLLAYNDRATGSGDIYTLQLNADGSPRGAPVLVEGTPAASDLPSLLKTDSGYLVAWQEGTAGKAVYLHALDHEGRPVGQGVTVAATASLEVRPVLSQAPGGIAVTWMDNPLGSPLVQIAIVDPSLKVRGPARIAATASGAGWPWVVGDDKSLVMTWSDREAAQFDIHFAKVDATTLTTSESIDLRDKAPSDALLGRLIRTTDGYLSAWEDRRSGDNEIYMAFTDPDGKKLVGGLVEEPESGDANWPNMVWTGSFAAFVYYQWRQNNPEIYLSLYDGQGKRVGGAHDFQVSSTPSGKMARFPDIQWTGSEFGVLWVDTRDGAPQLYFARMACKL